LKGERNELPVDFQPSINFGLRTSLSERSIYIINDINILFSNAKIYRIRFSIENKPTSRLLDFIMI